MTPDADRRPNIVIVVADDSPVVVGVSS